MIFQRTSTPLAPIRPDFTWKVPSKSKSGTFHKVGWNKRYGFECDCMAYKECWHIKIIKLKYADKLQRV